MRAVNLLPSDLRGAAPKPARGGARPEPRAEGIGAYLVLGSLVLCVAALAGYVLLTNGIEQRQADLQAAEQRTTQATTLAAKLKPYADFEATAKARVETVRGLAAARFDWEQALRDVSRAVPAGTFLSALNGDMGLPGATGGGGDPLRGAIQAPAITMAGCAPSQRGVATMMSRIRAVDGVTRVSLSKSIRGSAAAGGSNDSASANTASACKATAPQFSLVIFFERSAALAALSQSGVEESSVLVPNAVSGSGGTAAAGTTPPAAGTPTPAAGTSAPAATATPAPAATATPAPGEAR